MKEILVPRFFWLQSSKAPPSILTRSSIESKPKVFFSVRILFLSKPLPLSLTVKETRSSSLFYFQGYLVRVSMLADIGQGFLQDPIDSGLGRQGKKAIEVIQFNRPFYILL